MTPAKIWLAFSTLVILASLASGYRASRAAGVPQYLMNKTSVVVERPAVAADEQEAEIQRRFAEAGEADLVGELQPMFVLGLLDGALPIVFLSGVITLGISRLRRQFATGGPDGL